MFWVGTVHLWRIPLLSSLHLFELIAGDDLHDGNVGSCEEADQSHQADEAVLHEHQWRQTLCVKHHDLEDWREDQSQETAADRADQWDDKVQLRYKDSKDTWRKTYTGTWSVEGTFLNLKKNQNSFN